MKQWMLAALVGLMVCGTAVAAPMGGSTEDRFDRMDANKDGKVSWEEFEAAMPQMRKSAFEAIDADKNGLIDRTEWDSFRKDHGQSGMSAKPGMPEQTAPAPSGTLPLIQPPKK